MIVRQAGISPTLIKQSACCVRLAPQSLFLEKPPAVNVALAHMLTPHTPNVLHAQKEHSKILRLKRSAKSAHVASTRTFLEAQGVRTVI